MDLQKMELEICSWRYKLDDFCADGSAAYIFEYFDRCLTYADGCFFIKRRINVRKLWKSEHSCE